ncbi:MAG: hypothetical protein OIN66_03020 [Candidatus Methanoperedens sp.]|nr:hypothetical protein [Candidatus Methanoperedens sp.]
MDNLESELIFSKEGITIRTKTNFPFVGEDWAERKIAYEEAFNDKKMEILVTSIEPKIENGILKEIKLKLNNIREIAPSILEDSQFGKSGENVRKVEPIKMITNRSIKNLPEGTKIRFDWKGITYETQIDSKNGKKLSLNSLVRDVCQTSKGDSPSINIYQHIKARFLDEKGWHSLNDLRT